MNHVIVVPKKNTNIVAADFNIKLKKTLKLKLVKR